MRLTTRMWLLGAVLPAAGTIAALLAGGVVFRASLERGVDQALEAQASSERVSLFDAPDGRPHIHVNAEGIDEAHLTTRVTLYGPDGAPVASWPRNGTPGERVLPGDPSAPPRLFTVGRERVLRVTSQREGGDRYVLELVATLASVDRAVRTFYRVTFAIALALAALLFALHGLHARRLTGRVQRLADHMVRLREGQLDDAPRDGTRDEIGALSDVVAEATARLREARAAQARLLADAAHELRTPLTLVRTTVDVALRHPQSAPALVGVLHEVRGEVDRVAQLATRLLDVAAAGQGAWDRAPGDLVEVARDAVEAARAAAEDRGLLVALVAPGPVRTTFHADGVRQAIDNLLSNALRYAPRGTTVEVRVSPLAGGGGAIAVHDDGPGIPDEERELVFEPFRRAAPSPGGAGLGLAIVREIAARHGGRAHVARDDRGGATVVVELPGERAFATALPTARPRPATPRA